jgi:hypothetical protein
MKTKRVRIAVAMQPDGDWNSAGWGSVDGGVTVPDDEKRRIALDPMDDHCLLSWVEADVPVPDVGGDVVEGEVVDV